MSNELMDDAETLSGSAFQTAAIATGKARLSTADGLKKMIGSDKLECLVTISRKRRIALSSTTNYYKYVRITSNTANTQSNRNPKPTTKQHAIV